MTRTVWNESAGQVQKLRFSGTAPAALPDPGRLARHLSLMGALLQYSAPPGSTTPISLWPKLLGPWPTLPLSPSLSCWVVGCSPGCILVMSVSLCDGRVRLAEPSVSGRWPTWAISWAFWCSALLLVGSGSSGSCWGLSGPDRPQASCPPH